MPRRDATLWMSGL